MYWCFENSTTAILNFKFHFLLESFHKLLGENRKKILRVKKKKASQQSDIGKNYYDKL